uniref:ANK_REP_REGION domain-containing protein n=1 Tax=Globodera pallida TaxID=36090 RepID=A0A183CK55_GLOPA
MGNYKSRPQLSCADELKKRISEGYAIVRSKLNDDIKPKFDARSALHINCFQGTLEEFRAELGQADKSIEEKVNGRELSLLHLVCIGVCEQQSEKIRLLLDRCGGGTGAAATDSNGVEPCGNAVVVGNGVGAGGDASGTDAQRRVLALLQQRTRNGFSALHIAVYKGDKGALQTLLEAGAEPNATAAAPGVPPPLHLAAMSGNVEVLRVLVAHGANLQAQDFVRYTALHCATYFGHVQVVRELLEAGADPNASGGVHDRPIHIAAGKANPAMLKAFLEAGADPTLPDDEGNTALHFAAKTGHCTSMGLLLDRAKDARQFALQSNLYGDTAFLEAGADPTLPDDEGNTALHFAAKTGHCTSMGLLLDRAKDARQFALQSNLYGDTALHSACYCGRMDAVKQLLAAAGSEVLGMENLFSETPLMAACTAGRFELVCFLMRQPEVDPNHQAQDGHTALHSACFHGHIRVVQYLLDNGADQSLTARAVDSPLINQFGNNNNKSQLPATYNGISPFGRMENAEKNLVANFFRSGVNTVSQLKDRWEQMSVGDSAGIQTQKGAVLSSSPAAPPSSALEKLKQRVDQHGYVSQSARAIAAAKGATQLRDSFAMARRAANVAQRQSALIRKAAENVAADVSGTAADSSTLMSTTELSADELKVAAVVPPSSSSSSADNDNNNNNSTGQQLNNNSKNVAVTILKKKKPMHLVTTKGSSAEETPHAEAKNNKICDKN